MNITPSLIYWVSRLDIINDVSTLVAIFSGLVMIVTFLIPVIFEDEIGKDEARVTKKAAKMSSCAFVVSALLAILVPTAKDVAAMVVVPKIANSESVKDIGAGIVDLAKAWIEELKPNKRNK